MRLAACLDCAPFLGDCVPESGGKPCHFDPDNCDLNGDGNTDCADMEIFIALSLLCCGVPPEDEPGARDAAILDLVCLWYGLATEGVCGRSTPPPCGEVLGCAAGALGRSLTAAEVEKLAECSGCDAGCQGDDPMEEGCYSVPPLDECDVNGDGEVDAADAAGYVGLAARCMASDCEDELTDQQISDLICDFAIHCGLDCLEALRALDLALDEAPTPAQDRALLVCLGCISAGTMSEPNADPGEPSDGAQSDGPSGSDCGDKEEPTTDDPVNLRHRIKVENVTDLTVSLPGRDFSIVRSYTSDPGYTGASLVGEHWSLNCFRFLRFPGGMSGTSPVTIALHGASPTSRGYCGVAGSGWAPAGTATWSFTQTTLTLGSDTYDVLRLTEPGQYEMDFILTVPSGAPHSTALLVGLLLQERDVYGNKWTYSYGTYGSTARARLEAIYLNGESRADAAAVVQFTWNTDVAVTGAFGKLDHVQVLRQDSTSAWRETDRVEYVYKEGASDHLGTEGDLVQVAQRTAVSHGAAMRTRITQYRYHDSTVTTAPTNHDDRIQILGEDHQLKLVIEPEQVEFFAQKANSSWTTAAHLALDAGASLLRTKLDNDTLFVHASATYRTLDIASKVFSYSGTGDSPVVTQYLQTGCGCSGGTQGLKLVYEGFGNATNPTTRITQLRFSGSVTSSDDYNLTHLSTCYDMAVIDNTAYLVNKAIFETGTSREWVTHRSYDANGLLLKEMMPSALDSYTPTITSSAATYSASTSVGLVHAYVYTADKRLSERYFKDDGSDSASDTTSLTGYTLTQRTNYPASSVGNERKFLPTSIERFRVAGSSSANDVETTWFEYDFHSGDAVAWVRTSVEAELPSENGPETSDTYGETLGSAVVYSTYDLYDDKGLLRWSRSADGSLSCREYDAATGEVVTSVQNADIAGETLKYDSFDNAEFANITAITTDRNADGGSLVTTYRLDLLGRTIRRTTPGGVHSYTVRRMVPFFDRPGVLYYSVVSLPHKLAGTSTFNGPASVSWINADGDTIGSSDFTLASPSSYDPDNLVFAFEPTTGPGVGEIARSVVRHAPTGLVSSSHVWHDVSGDGSYATQYTYDKLGRLDYTVPPTLSVTQKTYDVLDRVIKVEVGTFATLGSLTTVAEYFYDSGQTTTSGVGDGNLTLIRQSTGDTALTAVTDRDTEQHFDKRNRLQKVVTPEKPYQFMEYDNLDRVTHRALFKVNPTGIDVLGERADRGIVTITDYSQRGMPYKRRIATDPTLDLTSSAQFLESNMWYDQKGREIANWVPNTAGSKRIYDGLGRVITEYATDRGSDDAPGTTGNHADAVSATGDTVFEQTNPTYNPEGRLSRVTHWQRNHNATATGLLESYTLSSSIAVRTFVDNIYDNANRRIGTINYGTNDTSSQRFVFNTTAPSVQTALPAFDDSAFTDAVISKIIYNARGLVESSTDSVSMATLGDTERTTKYLYDDLSRRIAVAENYTDAQIVWSAALDGGRWEVDTGLDPGEPEVDRVTTYVYDGSSNVVKQVAHLPGVAVDGESVQITEYVYGTTVGSAGTTTNSLVASFDLLKEVWYPDETSGAASSSNKVQYAYNALGELRSVVDQNGTRHQYSRDAMGRVTADHAAVIGSGIDTAIAKIEVEYDDFSRLEFVKSLNSSSTVKNAVEFTYTPLWQVERIYQDHNGPIARSGTTPTGDTVDVLYSYSTSALSGSGSLGGGNYSRLNQFRNPDLSVIYHGYGASATPNNRISRLTGLSRAAFNYSSTFPDLVEYQYVGLGMFAVTDYVQPDVQLDRTLEADGTRNVGGHYHGWDHLGRVIHHAWVDGNLTAGSGSGTGYPTRPPVFSESYHYDRASNRVARWDSRPGTAGWADRDFKFEYDGLDRLKEAKRGVYNPGAKTIAVGKGSQQWDLDMLGNWVTFNQDLDGSGAYETSNGTGVNELQSRQHNMANELSEADRNVPGSASVTLPFNYDDAGNMKDRLRSSTLRSNYTHDAWNRLVKVDNYSPPPFGSGTTTTISEYEYNGLHWRTMKRIDTTTPADGLDQHTLMYYDASWRLFEERVDDAYSSSFAADRHMQNIWGARYIDDLIARRRDVNRDGDYVDSGDATWYAVTDVQFSVVAMLTSGGKLYERVAYDSYGTARHHWKDDVDGDGDVDSSDKSIVTGLALAGKLIYQSGYNPNADIDRSGAIDSTDAGFVSSTTIAALAVGEISDRTSTGPASVVGYDGYVFNPENTLYTVRHRHYDAGLGRWLERDPAGYIAGVNLYNYCSDVPIGQYDPSGLEPEKSTVNNLPYEISNSNKKCIETLLEALQQACPQAKLVTSDGQSPWSMATNRNTGNSYKKWVDKPGEGHIDASGDDAKDCEADCKNPPGCKLLQTIGNNTKFPVTLADPERKRKDGTTWYASAEYNRNNNKGEINWNCEKRLKVTGVDGKKREAEPWEVLWHELYHAYHDVQGIRDEHGAGWEEVRAIDGENEIIKWRNKCTKAGKENPTPERDPFSHDRSKGLKGAPRPWTPPK